MMSKFVILLTFPCIAAAAKGVDKGIDKKSEPKPLITTELFYNTYDLLRETTNAIYDKSGIDPQVKLATKQVKTQVDELAKNIPPEVWEHKKQFDTIYIQVQATAANNFELVREVADKRAADVVKMLEAQVPEAKGLIKKSAANLVLFLAYVFLILFVTFKLVKFVISTFMCFVCGIFCCRFCRSRNNSDNSKLKKKVKANGTQPAQPASQSNVQANAKNPQAAPKAKVAGKKK